MLRFPWTNRNKRFLVSCNKLKKKLGSLFFPFYWCLGPLHTRPATGLLGYRDGCCCLFQLGNFQPGRPGYMQFKKGLLYGFVNCFNFTTTSAVEKHTSQNLCHFCDCCWDSEAILSKNVSSRSPGLNCSYGKIFITNTEISVAKSDISVASYLKKLNLFSEEKGGDARSRKSSQFSRPGTHEEAPFFEHL